MKGRSKKTAARFRELRNKRARRLRDEFVGLMYLLSPDGIRVTAKNHLFTVRRENLPLNCYARTHCARGYVRVTVYERCVYMFGQRLFFRQAANLFKSKEGAEEGA